MDNYNLHNFLQDNIFNKNKEHEETYNHMLRCSIIAYKFGKFLNLSNRQIAKLFKLAFFHDIGKFKINPSVLYKKDRLTNFEFEKIKEHTLCPFIFKDDKINEVIKFHHERPDKKGYYGLDGHKLSDYTKIISIIDSYDVMSHKRSYKNSILSKNEIIEDIKYNADKQFDKQYALLFIDFLNNCNV